VTHWVYYWATSSVHPLAVKLSWCLGEAGEPLKHSEVRWGYWSQELHWGSLGLSSGNVLGEALGSLPGSAPPRCTTGDPLGPSLGRAVGNTGEALRPC
jgi:hypothetical protein